MADAVVSKTTEGNLISVRLRSPAPLFFTRTVFGHAIIPQFCYHQPTSNRKDNVRVRKTIIPAETEESATSARIQQDGRFLDSASAPLELTCLCRTEALHRNLFNFHTRTLW